MAQSRVPPDALRNFIEDRIAQIQRDEPSVIDAQEMAEREEAAAAYFGEDEKHFVDYCLECIKTSRNATHRIRQMMRECFQVYQEEEPPNYADKEDWQSRVVIPKPHAAVQFAKTQVRKAFSPQFLAIHNESNVLAGEFWREVMQRALDESHANFRICFPDATEMGLAVGRSMEMIPYWDAERGLQYSLVEPWKIHRDPDARSRDPQSGMYWIHEEYQDLWSLREEEKRGNYINVGGVKGARAKAMATAHNPENPDMDDPRTEELRKMLVERNHYREMALVRECWGVILDRRGEMLLPRHTYTIAGNKVISVGTRDASGQPLAPGPYPSPYRTLRWPGVAFSPIPHLLRFDGRGIVQGIRSLWYWMCTLMSLHSDNLNWIVNSMLEVNISGLADPLDIDIFPGKVWQTKDYGNGQQMVRTVDRRFITNEILANLQYGSQAFEEGTFVTSTVQGLPGYRQEITWRETAQHLDQSRDMFSTLGENVEDGALYAIRAGMETCMANMTMADAQALIGPRPIQEMLAEIEASGAPMELSPMGIPLPLLQGSFRVSGLTAVLKDLDVLKAIKEVWLPLTQDPHALPYLKFYNLLRSLEERTDVRDENWLATPAEAQEIATAQSEDQARALQVQQQLIEAQIAAEQQKLALEARKQELEAAKLMLEARKLQVEQQMQEVEAAVELETLAAERERIDQELRQQETEIRKTAVEIGETLVKIATMREKLELDRAKVRLQAEQGAAQLALQHKQMNAQIAAQRAQRNGNARARD